MALAPLQAAKLNVGVLFVGSPCPIPGPLTGVKTTSVMSTWKLRMSQEGKSPMNVITVPVGGGAGELEPQLRNSAAASANIKNTPSKRLNIN
jgi:hypothetical protein